MILRSPWWLLALALVGVALWLLLPLLTREPVQYRPHAGPEAAVGGHVVDPDGRPLAGVKLVWSARQSEMGGAMTSVYASTDHAATTDAEGRFLLGGLPSGDGQLTVDATDRQREGGSDTIEARPGQVADGVRIVATPIAADRRLRGRLRRADGTPAAFAFVVWRRDSWLGAWQGGASTDADGQFELIGDKGGSTGQLSAQLPGGETVDLGTATLGDSLPELTVPAPR